MQGFIMIEYRVYQLDRVGQTRHNSITVHYSNIDGYLANGCNP